MRSFLIGGLIGLLLSSVLVWFGLGAQFSRREEQATVGWDPVEVIVAAKEVAAGQWLAPADLRTIALPSQFVTPSAIPLADRASILGRRVHLPLQPGDPLVWQSLTDTGESEVEACVQASLPALRAAVSTATEQTLADLSGGMQPGEPPPLPGIVRAPDGSAELLVAIRDLVEGERVQAGDFEVRRAPPSMVAASAIPGSMAARLTGAKWLVPVLTGDVLHWQFLDAAGAVQTGQGCTARLEGQAKRVAQSAGAQQAAAFVAGRKEQR